MDYNRYYVSSFFENLNFLFDSFFILIIPILIKARKNEGNLGVKTFRGVCAVIADVLRINSSDIFQSWITAK